MNIINYLRPSLGFTYLSLQRAFKGRTLLVLMFLAHLFLISCSQQGNYFPEVTNLLNFMLIVALGCSVYSINSEIKLSHLELVRMSRITSIRVVIGLILGRSVVALLCGVSFLPYYFYFHEYPNPFAIFSAIGYGLIACITIFIASLYFISLGSGNNSRGKIGNLSFLGFLVFFIIIISILSFVFNLRKTFGSLLLFDERYLILSICFYIYLCIVFIFLTANNITIFGETYSPIIRLLMGVFTLGSIGYMYLFSIYDYALFYQIVFAYLFFNFLLTVCNWSITPSILRKYKLGKVSGLLMATGWEASFIHSILILIVSYFLREFFYLNCLKSSTTFCTGLKISKTTDITYLAIACSLVIAFSAVTAKFHKKEITFKHVFFTSSIGLILYLVILGIIAGFLKYKKIYFVRHVYCSGAILFFLTIPCVFYVKKKYNEIVKAYNYSKSKN